MAIKAVIGFEHLPQNDVTWANFATHGLTRAADSSLKSVIVNGWIVDKDTGGSACRYSIPLTPYIQAPVNKIWFSVRLRVNQNPNGAAGIIYLNNSYILIINELLPFALGTAYHLEFSYDVTTGVIERWLNGTKMSNSAQTPGAGIRALTFGLEGKGSVAAMIDWRDINVVDDQGVSLGYPVGPLGPREVVPVTFDTVDGSDWTTTPNGTSLLTAVSEPGSDPTAKYATSNINSKGPLTASMIATIPAGKNVAAIEMIATVQSNGSAAVNNATKLKKGTDEVAGSFLSAPSGSWNFNASLGVFHKAPGGQNWTNATIDATSVVLTPDV